VHARASLLILVILCLTALSASASAGEFKRDAAADVRVPGLKGAPKKALDIIGIDVTKTMFVTRVILRFKGNFERQMRNARLRKAGALVRLTLQGSADRTVVASIGSGRGHRVVGAGAGGPGASTRKGREVHLWVAGLDGNKLAKVEARSFQGAAARKSAWKNAEGEAARLLRLRKADEAASAPARPGESQTSDCERIRKIANDLEGTAPSQPGVRDVVDETKAFLARPPCSELLS
jgi:hypothetical protein